MNLLNILLMAPQATDGQGGGGMMSTLLMMGLIILVFYFFMIRPQMKRGKEERKYRENLQKGDRVMTTGGIHGKIVEIQESSFVIEIANNVNITIEKSAIVVIPNQQNKNN